MRQNTIDDFLRKTRETKDGCWQWLGAFTSGGYGQFRFRGSNVRAHRYSCEHYVGKIPEGLVIDHLCRNRACVNPKHLEVVTGRENNLRGIGPVAENARKKYCKRGHPLFGKNCTMKRKVRKNGAVAYERTCKACGNLTTKAYQKRQKEKAALDTITRLLE